MDQLPYNFTTRSFTYNGHAYKLALTAELYPDDGFLDFTGSYLGILISEKKGTSMFQLFPDPHSRWESEPKGMDPGLIDEIDKIITDLRNQA